MFDPESTLVFVKGAGDIASGVAVHLHRFGFPVLSMQLGASSRESTFC